MALVDSYSETNQNAGSVVASNQYWGVGQSFTGIDGVLNTAQFYLEKVGSPVGNAVAKIYDHTGTFGTNSTPTGSALASSDNFDVSTLTTSYQLITFTFTGVNKITLVSGTKYVVTFEYNGGLHAINYLLVGVDTTSPTHGGNQSRTTDGSSWSGINTTDAIFYVYIDDVTTTSTSSSTSTTTTSTSTTSTSTSSSTSTTTTIANTGIIQINLEYY